MKFLLFSDLHLDAKFSRVEPNVARSLRLSLRAALRRILALARDEQVDAVFCAGDLYEHERFTPATANFLKEEFSRAAPTRVFLAPGNHDWYGPESIYAKEQWSSNVHVFTRDHLEPVSLADGLTLWGAAHCAPANTGGFLKEFRAQGDGLQIALFHGSEESFLPQQESGKRPHAPFRSDQIKETRLAHAFVGHFHQPRDADLYTYAGNPSPLGFGESGARGAVIVELSSEGTLARTRHSMACSAFHDLDLDVSGALTLEDLQERLRAAIDPAWTEDVNGPTVVRASLRGEIHQDMDVRGDDLASAVTGVDALLVDLAGLRPAYDIEAIKEQPTVRGQFVRDVLASEELEESQKQRVLLVGLRALDGRSDLEVI